MSVDLHHLNLAIFQNHPPSLSLNPYRNQVLYTNQLQLTTNPINHPTSPLSTSANTKTKKTTIRPN